MRSFWVAALMVAGIGSQAQAVTTLTWKATDIGVSQTVDFGGITDAYKAHSVDLPGLSSEIKYTLTGVSGKKWTFAYAVDNTSNGAVTASRVSVFGFDVDKKLSSVAATGLFAKYGDGNVPLLGKADVCFRASSNGSECAGGGGTGLQIADLPASGTFSLSFEERPSAIALTDPFVRYQSIVADSLGVKNASGAGQYAMTQSDPRAVPEPASWALMITGFGMVGAALRRRRTGVVTA
jgi:hypothetical protein